MSWKLNESVYKRGKLQFADDVVVFSFSFFRDV